MTLISLAKMTPGVGPAESESGSMLEMANAAPAQKRSPSLELLFGFSPVMQQLRERIQAVALSQEPVLIVGPTGSGKELVSRALHELSPRSEGRWVPVNCGAIPEQLMESELFGHARGAFTGADSDKVGYFSAASKGTLLLDEIAELPTPLQPKLLRVLGDPGGYQVVGSTREVTFSGRLIASTHRDLARLVEENRFREDLYYRISGLEIRVPSLEERREDIPDLIHRFARLQERPIELSSSAIEALKRRRWRGNVRELRNVIHRISVFSKHNFVTAEGLEEIMTGDPTVTDSVTLKDIVRRILDLPDGNKLEMVEMTLISEALAKTRGNKTAAGRLLGVHRKAVERRVLSRRPPAAPESPELDSRGGSAL